MLLQCKKGNKSPQGYFISQFAQNLVTHCIIKCIWNTCWMAWCVTGVLIWYNNKTKHFLLMYLAGSENTECVTHSAFSLTENPMLHSSVWQRRGCSYCYRKLGSHPNIYEIYIMLCCKASRSKEQKGRLKLVSSKGLIFTQEQHSCWAPVLGHFLRELGKEITVLLREECASDVTSQTDEICGDFRKLWAVNKGMIILPKTCGPLVSCWGRRKWKIWARIKRKGMELARSAVAGWRMQSIVYKLKQGSKSWKKDRHLFQTNSIRLQKYRKWIEVAAWLLPPTSICIFRMWKTWGR